MTRIKIISDPYNRKLSFEKYDSEKNEWQQFKLNLDSKLREYDEEKMFLPFKIKEIVDRIIEDYYVNIEKIEIVFEGTPDEYEELEKICNEEDIKEKIILNPEQVGRVLENARDIIEKNKNEFDKVYPIIKEIVKDNSDITDELEKVSDALKDIIPICVIGNYSAGKSTFINALIGNEVLASGDDPVTAKVYEVKESSQDDRAKISFGFRTQKDDQFEEYELLFDNKGCKVLKGNDDSLIVQRINETLSDYEETNLFSMIHTVVEILNDFEKVDTSFTLISNVVSIEVPFSENGIIGRSKNNFVIFDTPGSNSKTNIDHEMVLRDALKGFSNGIPVWVCTADSMDTNDNAELCEKIDQIEALDKRFTMIISNRADSANLDKFDEDTIMHYESVEKMYSSGIYYVSSVMGLGAKNENAFQSSFIKKVFKSNKDQFGDPEDEFYTKLYEYNIMPEQMKAKALEYSSKEDNLIYANSGLLCVEKEMDVFASKHSAYNKCMMVYLFLNKFQDEITKIINDKTERLDKRKKKWEADLNVKEQALITDIRKDTIELVKKYDKTSKSFIKDFQKEKLNYSRTTDDLAKLDSEYSEEESLEKNFSAFENEYENAKNTRMNNLKENIHKLPKGNIKDSAKELLSDLVTDSKKVKTQKESLDTTKKGIDSETSDRLIEFVVEEYKNNFNDAQDKIIDSAEKHWKVNEDSYRSEMVKLVTGSDALSSKHKEQLSSVIMNYQPLEFNDEAEKVFIKERFLKGNILGLKFFASEKIDLFKLSLIYNAKMKQIISDLADSINDSCFDSFKSWQERLKSEIEKNIADYNPELRELSELIQEEENRIQDLESNKKDILKAVSNIKENMSWKEVSID